MLYAMLPNKEQKTYSRLFDLIKPSIQTPPSHVTVDFELAAVNAIRGCFSEAQINGCYFHFSNNLFEKIKT